ncbi:hypothetical protein E2562_018652 [Oryza meyeriana var. granulata]|uniref:Uncharacterized protein n=1 Tax=Oryza meyeriana var. granulata TaxID=110450 RepID=A0A6G1BXX8_9ORYZ|nr:hypothetical protein E2562_018652 [Oryza meyeriana var. granulata]
MEEASAAGAPGVVLTDSEKLRDRIMKQVTGAPRDVVGLLIYVGEVQYPQPYARNIPNRDIALILKESSEEMCL